MSTEIIPTSVGETLLYTEVMKKAEQFEQFFVEAIEARVESSSLSHSEFGRRVFESDSGPRLWRAAREQGRKRGLSVGEAYLMAEALGIEFPALIWEIVQEAKHKGILT